MKTEQEPVGEMIESAIYEGLIVPCVEGDYPVGTKLYLAPPQRTWVGLTDEEKNVITWGNDIYKILELAEAKLKQKNGYAEENT